MLLFGHRSFRFPTPLESRQHSPITRGVSVHSCIVPSLGEGEIGDSAGEGNRTVSRLTCVSCSFPSCRTALACRPQQQPGGGADASGPAGSDPSFIHPSSSILSLFCVFFSSFPCALRVSFRAAAAEGKWWWHRQLRASTPSCPSLSQKQSEAICSASDIGCGVFRSAPFQK